MATLLVTERDDLVASLAGAGVPMDRPVAVVIGSANLMGEEELAQAGSWFDEGLVPAVVAAGAIVVDGGTDSGVMRLTGLARRSHHVGFALVGVTPEGTVETTDHPEHQAGRAALEPNHSLHVLIPGSSWGDESPWITRVARAIAGSAPVVGLLVKGGEIAERDAAHLLAANLPLVVLPWWGGAAERFAASAPGSDPARPLRILVFDPARGPDALAALLAGMLGHPV